LGHVEYAAGFSDRGVVAQDVTGGRVEVVDTVGHIA
jgi:hypothetical protein